MKKSIVFAGLAVAAVFAAGCGPKLSQEPLSPKEQQWKDFIEAEYPSWESPERWPTSARYDEAYTPAELQRMSTTSQPAVVEPLDIPAEDLIPEYQYEEDFVEEEYVEEETAAPAEVVYTVQKGDTLSAIALKYYGNAGQWKQILEANPVLDGKPNKIRIGQELIIPNPTRM